MTTAHKHAELIHAWADGATIQFKYVDQLKWDDCGGTPMWCSYNDYRIKPEPTPDYSKFGGLYEGDGYNEIQGVTSDINKVPQESTDASGHWTLVNKLELIFDGETKELKDVKIHGKE